MGSFKKLISVRTPVVVYDKKTEETGTLLRTSENILNFSIQSRNLLKPSNIVFTSNTPEPNENRPNSLEKTRKVKRLGRLVMKRPESIQRKCFSIDHKSEGHEKYFTQISLRYKAHGKSTEVKVLRRNMQSNDALIVERIATPSNLYLKEIQAFSVSRNRLVRKKKALSINLFRQK